MRHFTFTWSNGKNVDIYLHNNFNLVKMLMNMITILSWRKERYKSLSPWICKELPIWMTTSVTFSLSNEKPFSFDSIVHYKVNMQTWRPTLRTPYWFWKYCHQSSLLVRSPSNSMFYRSVRVSNKAIENLLLISSLYNEN